MMRTRRLLLISIAALTAAIGAAKESAHIEQIRVERFVGPSPYTRAILRLRIPSNSMGLLEDRSRVQHVTTAKGYSYVPAAGREDCTYSRSEKTLAEVLAPPNASRITRLSFKTRMRPKASEDHLTFLVGKQAGANSQTTKNADIIARHIRSEALGFNARAEFEITLKGYTRIGGERQRKMPELVYSATDKMGAVHTGKSILCAKSGNDRGDTFLALVTYPLKLKEIQLFNIDIRRYGTAEEIEFNLSDVDLRSNTGTHLTIHPSPALIHQKGGFNISISGLHLYHLISNDGELLKGGSGFELQVSAIPEMQSRLRQLLFPAQFYATDRQGRQFHYLRSTRAVNPYVMRVGYRCESTDILSVRTLTLSSIIEDLTDGKVNQIPVSFDSVTIQADENLKPGQPAKSTFWSWLTTYSHSTSHEQRSEAYGQLLQLRGNLPMELLPPPPLTGRKLDYWRVSHYKDLHLKQNALLKLQKTEKRTPRPGKISEPQMLAVACRKRPKIDGDLSDWTLTAQMIVCENGKKDAELFRCDLAFMFDSEALYIGVDWVDVSPMGNMMDATRCALLSHMGDSLQLLYQKDNTCYQADCWFSQPINRSVVYVHPSQSKPITMKPGLGAFYSSTNSKLGDGVEQAFSYKTGRIQGYIQEIRLPWSSLGLQPPEADSQAPCMVRLSWGNYRVERQYLVNIVGRVKHAYWPFETPAAYGKLTFSGKAPAYNVQRQLTISKMKGSLDTVSSFETKPDPAIAVFFVTNDKLLIIGGEGNVRTVVANTGRVLRIWQCGRGRIRAAALSPDANLLGRAGKDRALTIWDRAKPRKPILTLRGARKSITAIAFSHSNKLVAATSFDGHVRVWDLKTGITVADFDCVKALRAVAFSPKDDLLCAGGVDRKIYVCSLRTKEITRTLTGHEFGIRTLGFIQDDVLISGADDMTLRMWNLKTGEVRHELLGHASLLSGQAVINRNRLLSCAFDNNIIAWDLRTGKMSAMQAVGSNGLAQLSLSPSGKRVAALDRTGKISILKNLE